MQPGVGPEEEGRLELGAAAVAEHTAAHGVAILPAPEEARQAVGPARSPRSSTDSSRIWTLRTLPVTVIGNSSTTCT